MTPVINSIWFMRMLVMLLSYINDGNFNSVTARESKLDFPRRRPAFLLKGHHTRFDARTLPPCSAVFQPREVPPCSDVYLPKQVKVFFLSYLVVVVKINSYLDTGKTVGDSENWKSDTYF